jgi:crotonobetainyl-CoA:carnitine CoA-transferase CaiB-like acyl-CoA transferase
MSGPLSGLRIVEVANMMAAPSAGAILADLGADVVKVEPPTGDILRGAHRVVGPGAGPGPHPDAYFTVDNRGKRSLVVDLGRDAGVAVVHRLVERADVFITNLTDERRVRYRLTPPDLLAVQPRLVYSSVGGYGSTGPAAGKPGYDWTAFFARGGVSSVIGEPDDPPLAFRPGQGDHTTALALLVAILTALRERDRSGAGQVVEAALFQVAAWTLASDLAASLVDGEQPRRFARRDWPNPLTCRYRCADGKWVALCMPGPRDYWDGFCIALERTEWIFDERYAEVAVRLQHAAELIAAIDERLAELPRDDWGRRFDEAGVIWAPVQQLPELIDDPQAAAMGLFQPVLDEANGLDFRTVGVPFRMHGADIAVRGPAPGLGQHTQQVLAEAGFDADEIAALESDGVLGEIGRDRARSGELGQGAERRSKSSEK